jgi:2-dehydro-3-deoxyglucarate aldolase
MVDGHPMKRVRQQLEAGEVSLGSWLSFGSTEVCELVARAGFEWLVVDAEHTSIGVAQQASLIQTIELCGLGALVRVGANDPLLIKRALDAGAHGIIVPMVNSAAEARAAVAAAHYPPRGTRGVGLSRAQGYGLTFEQYRKEAEETFVVVQIEHVRAVENLEDILEVSGVDAFIVGPYDLSGSVGQPGNWDAPEVIEALDEVERVVASARKPAGFHVVHSGDEELRG